MSKLKIAELPPVARTLLIPLAYRALESRRPDALLRDARAVELAAQFDEDFTRLVQKLDFEQVGVLLRTRQLDQYARSFLDVHPDGVVVDIGCGLDTRFERLDNGAMRWFGLDLPEVIALRQRFLPGDERARLIAGSALDFDWMDMLNEAGGSRKLFLAEGVFPYFSAAEVKRLVLELAERFPGAELAFDAISPLSRFIHRFHPGIRKAGVTIGWGLANGKELEAWRKGIRLVEECFYFIQPEPRLGAFNLLRYLPGMGRMNYIVHYRLGVTSGR